MTIAVFGISGRTGAALVEAASSRGLSLVGLARRAEGVRPAAHVKVIEGALTDRAVVTEVVRGTEATVCVFGPRPPHRTVFCAEATDTIVAAMRAVGSRRLLCQTGAMVGDLLPNVSPAMRWMARRFERARPAVAADRAAQERLVRTSQLVWTLVKPPRLRSGPAGRRVRAGPTLRVGLLSSISRAALAGFLLDQVTDPRFVGQAVHLRDSC